MAQLLTGVKGPFSVKDIQEDTQQAAIFLYPDTYNKTIWESKWNHMWEQVQQLFKLYYKFHFPCPGIFNTTFEPHLKTSNFFLHLSRQELMFFFYFDFLCMSEQKRMLMLHMCWALPLLCGGEFLVDSYFLSFLGTHPEQLPTKSHRSQTGKYAYAVKNICCPSSFKISSWLNFKGQAEVIL